MSLAPLQREEQGTLGESLELRRMQSQEDSACLSPSPGFTSYFSLSESDCTETEMTCEFTR